MSPEKPADSTNLQTTRELRLCTQTRAKFREGFISTTCFYSVSVSYLTHSLYTSFKLESPRESLYTQIFNNGKCAIQGERPNLRDLWVVQTVSVQTPVKEHQNKEGLGVQNTHPSSVVLASAAESITRCALCSSRTLLLLFNNPLILKLQMMCLTIRLEPCHTSKGNCSL